MGCVEALGRVADRLVGGMMFHSDHADTMRLIGFGNLARLHEDGYHDDSKSLRKVHRACIDHLGVIVPQGSQARPEHADVGDVGQSGRRRMLRSSMEEWAEWESCTSRLFAECACEMTNAALWDLVHGLQSNVDMELAGARSVMARMDACDWDPSVVVTLDM